MGLFGNKKKKETTIPTVGTPTEQKAPIVTNGQTAPTPQQQVEKTVAQPVVKQPLPQQQVPGQVIQQTPVQQQVQTPAPVSVASPTPISIGANQTQVPVSNKTITNQPISASLQTPEQKSTTQDSPPQQHSTSKTVQTSSLSKKKVSSDEDVKRKNKLNGYSYVVINTMNKKEKGYFDAESEDDVRAFLEGQDYQVLEIKPKSAMDIDISGPPKLNPEELSFALTQLSTYIKSGIPLVDSMRILAKQGKKATHKKIYGQVVYELLKGESFSVALARQGKVFPPLLINMVKTAEMTGDLPSILDDMAEYYTSMNQTKKQMKSAMTYPIVVLTIALGVLVFMLVYLVPQFASMFESQDAKLPAITLIVLGVSDFIQTNWMFLIGGVVAIIFIFRYLFKHVQSFKKAVQIFLMHIPVVSKIIIYNEIANFTKTFASLINHGVFITDSMEILQKITDNEVFKDIINKTLENLSRGEPVSAAFRGEWAIPVVAYEMIVTGENTGQLGLMMEKVSAHFQSMHKSIIDQMKSLMEPLMIVFLAGIVGVILLSIVTPMFSIYSQIE
jgi:type IV pilus assembly protein PilC